MSRSGAPVASDGVANALVKHASKFSLTASDASSPIATWNLIHQSFGTGSWKFVWGGDGTFSITPPSAHAVNFTFSVTDANGCTSNVASETIRGAKTCLPGQAPKLSPQGFAAAVGKPLTASLTSAVTSTNPIASWRLISQDFASKSHEFSWRGDGTFSIVEPSAGTSHITYSVTDSKGCTSKAGQVTVRGEKIVAHLAATEVGSGLGVELSADGSASSVAGALSYTFSFGDGQSVTSATPDVSHTYPSASNFGASVTVTDSKGNVATALAPVDLDVTKQGGGGGGGTSGPELHPVADYEPFVMVASGEKYLPRLHQRLHREQSVDVRPRCGNGIGLVRIKRTRGNRWGESLVACIGTVVPLARHRLLGQRRNVFERSFGRHSRDDDPLPQDDISVGVDPARTVEFGVHEQTHQGFYLDLNNADYGGNPGMNAPMYYQYVPDKYIAYWFFYDFNGFDFHGVTEYHEGDWEHIVVDLSSTNHMTGVDYYEHTCTDKHFSVASMQQASTSNNYGEKTGSNLYQKAFLVGTEPLVFSALGGHASYPQWGTQDTHSACGASAWEIRPPWGLSGTRIADQRDDGTVVRIWRCVGRHA